MGHTSNIKGGGISTRIDDGRRMIFAKDIISYELTQSTDDDIITFYRFLSFI